MVEKRVMVNNATGLQSRAAANFIDRSKDYQSDIYIEMEDRIYNGKSIMSILSMGAGPGASILLRCDGPDEEKAIRALEHYLAHEIQQY